MTKFKNLNFDKNQITTKLKRNFETKLERKLERISGR